MLNAVSIFDTTLRDGTQGEGISLSVEDKLKIAQRLDELGVQYIEGGWPGSNNKDIEFFIRAKQLVLKNAKITAFGSTRRKDTRAEDDPNLSKIIESGVTVATIFGKSWDFHVHTALQTTLEENLAMIYDSIRFLKSKGLEVIYDGEHFFDGYKNNEEYALKTIEQAVNAGADWVVLCDTNGGSMPGEILSIVSRVCSLFPTRVGIHAHNDCELGVANSLAAVQAGARQVQGTINGFGERCGNANLVSIIPNLQLKLGYEVISDEQLASLYSISRYINEVANVNMPSNQPFVGSSAFAHKGGIHVSAILKHASTYEHIVPELVGNKQRVLVSELAGQSNLVFKAQELGMDINLENTQSRKIIEKIKGLEHQGYSFEGADGSLELLLREAAGQLVEIFTVESFKILVEKSAGRPVCSEAIVKLKVHGETVYTAAEGNGPVNALDSALRKALAQFYPVLKEMHLSDSKVRVLVESTDFLSTWNTVGVSGNIIEASWNALVDSMRYALIGKTRVETEHAESEQHGIVNH